MQAEILIPTSNFHQAANTLRSLIYQARLRANFAQVTLTIQNKTKTFLMVSTLQTGAQFTSHPPAQALPTTLLESLKCLILILVQIVATTTRPSMSPSRATPLERPFILLRMVPAQSIRRETQQPMLLFTPAPFQSAKPRHSKHPQRKPGSPQQTSTAKPTSCLTLKMHDLMEPIPQD